MKQALLMKASSLYMDVSERQNCTEGEAEQRE